MAKQRVRTVGDLHASIQAGNQPHWFADDETLATFESLINLTHLRHGCGLGGKGASAALGKLKASLEPAGHSLSQVNAMSLLEFLRAVRGLGEPAASTEPARLPEVFPGSWANARDLSGFYGVPHRALRERLYRFVQEHRDGKNWKDIPDRKPRESKYSFRVEAVMGIVEDLLAKQTAGR